MIIFLIVIICVLLSIESKAPTTRNQIQNNLLLMERTAKICFIILIILTVIVLFLVIAFVVVRSQEQTKLFQPDTCKKYKDISGKFYYMKSGGVLVNINPDVSPEKRRVLFIHGNSMSIDAYSKPLYCLAALGYNVWAVEYGGYGIAKGSRHLDSPNCKTVLQDTREAYAICGHSDMIVMGFSLGGAILGELYDSFNPSPSQIVFLNTFYNLPKLVAEKLKTIGPLIQPLLRTQWVTKKPRKYKGKVMIVSTKDDQVVTPSQGRQLCKIFASLNPICIMLPNGGHRRSALIYIDSWANPTVLLQP